MIIVSQKFNRVSVARTVAIVALAVGLLLQCIGAWTDSQTIDEGAHLTAGLSYWRTGDFRLNPEHPPLLKLLAALPLLPNAKIQPAADAQLWAERDQWNIGRLVLYQQLDPRTETQTVLWWARLPMILVWLGLGWIVWRWAEERTAPWGGAMAATLFAFEPTLLGHGHLVTTDVGIAAGMTLTLWLALKLVNRPRWSLVLWVAVVMSLTQLTKYSALLLWPLLFGLLALATQTSRLTWNWQWWRRTLVVTIAFSAVLTWAIYGFERLPTSADPRIDRLWRERDAIAGTSELSTLPMIAQRLVEVTPPGSVWRTRLQTLSAIPIPAYTYWRGFFAVMSHNAMGHTAYLFGEQRSQGWWYYFPVALAVKTTLPMLGLGLTLVAVAIARRRRLWQTQHLFLVAPAVLYLIWSMAGKINIGVRHVLPLYPLFIIGSASLVRYAARPWHRALLAITVLLVPVLTLAAWPNTIGYFNAFAGGTNGGHRIILDSNLDWDQDVWRLRSYLDEQSVPSVMIALFGSVPVEIAHQHPRSIPTDSDVAADGLPQGLVVISKGLLYSYDLPFQWLKKRTPTVRIGSSILVYDLR